MPPFGGQLPQYQYPGNAMVNFQPVAEALDSYQKGVTVAGESTAKINAANAMARGDFQGASAELAKVDPQAATALSLHPGKMEGQQNELRMQAAKMLGGHAQTIMDAYTKDPAAGEAAARKWLSSDPKFATGLTRMGIADWQADPMGAVKAIHGEALGAQDPEKQALERAQASHLSVSTVAPGAGLVNVNPDRGAVGAEVASRGVKPPTGYEPDPAKPGEFRPMIGGPADIKFTEAKHAALTRVEAVESGLLNLKSHVSGLLSAPGMGGNFGWSGLVPNFPGGDAANAKTRLEQLKARGGFNELQAMRDSSKTGGALGNVSNAEGTRLENAFGRLQTAQSEESARAALKEIVDIASQAPTRLRTAYERQYGNAQPAATPTHNAGSVNSSPSPGSIPEGQPGSRASPVYPRTPADATKLPSGTYFLTPDGRLKVAP